MISSFRSKRIIKDESRKKTPYLADNFIPKIQKINKVYCPYLLCILLSLEVLRQFQFGNE